MDKILIKKSLLLQILSFKQIRIYLNNFLLDPRLWLWENVSSFYPNDQGKIKKVYLERGFSHDFSKKETSESLHWFNPD